MSTVLDLSLFNSILHDDTKYYSKIDELGKKIVEDVDSRREILQFGTSKISRSNLLTTFILAKPFKSLEEEFTEEFTFILKDCNEKGNYNVNLHNVFYDKIINKIYNYDISDEKIKLIKKDIAWSVDELSIFSTQNVLYQSGVTYSLFDIIDIMDRNEEFKKTLEFELDPELKDDIGTNNQKIAENKDKMIQIIKEDKDNITRDLIMSGAGINIKQFNQNFGLIGYKPDLYGKVITTPINSSFVRGIKNVTEFFIDAVGGRKAIITAKDQVKQSGYTNRKISILTEDSVIYTLDIDPQDKELHKDENNVDSCNTSHYINIHIRDKDMLSLYNHRWMYDEDTNKTTVITKNDTHLIGKDIKIFSPITCAHSKGICPRCYGRLEKINKHIKVGTAATLELTNPLTQKILSTKHLLEVIIKDANWSKDFLSKFQLFEDKVSPISDNETIYIHKDDLMENEDSEKNKYQTRTIYVKGRKDTQIRIDTPLSLIIPNEIADDIEQYYDNSTNNYVFSLKYMPDNEYMFNIIVENDGIADPLLKIKDILEKNHFIRNVSNNDYSIIVQEIVNLLVDSGTMIDSVHVETIVREMVSLENNDRTEFANAEELPKYNIYNVSDAILIGKKSPAMSLLYQNIEKQFKTDSYNDLFGKDVESEFDRVFR
ncbi:DNA-directed RNA polymerase subunit beta' [Listeria phage LPJP1]|nr:DNA-directed RNA polymerase subunit beta' [Listeria phage LPJP1]